MEKIEEMEVLVLLDVVEIEDKNKFEKHLKREGFKIVEEEEFVYTAKSSTTMFSTKAYILEVFKKGLQKTNFKSANLVFLLNETPYPPYYYDNTTKEFELVEENKED